LENHLEELIRGDVGVADDPHVYIAWNLAQQLSEDSGLSGADFAGQENEANAIYEPVLEIAEGHPMLGAGVEKTGIRYDAERLFAKTVKFFIHRFFTDYKRNKNSKS